MSNTVIDSSTESYWYQYHRTLGIILNNYLQMFAVVLAYDYSGLFRFNVLELLAITYLGLSLVILITNIILSVVLKDYQNSVDLLLHSLFYPISPVIFEYRRYKVWYEEQVYRSTHLYAESDHDSFRFDHPRTLFS